MITAGKRFEIQSIIARVCQSRWRCHVSLFISSFIFVVAGIKTGLVDVDSMMNVIDGDGSWLISARLGNALAPSLIFTPTASPSTLADTHISLAGDTGDWLLLLPRYLDLGQTVVVVVIRWRCAHSKRESVYSNGVLLPTNSKRKDYIKI